jgi:hypothetical protein
MRAGATLLVMITRLEQSFEPEAFSEQRGDGVLAVLNIILDDISAVSFFEL